MPSDPRDELLRQMARLRRSLDPQVVRRLDLARDGKVPYDRDTAQDAVKRFLETRHDGGRFRQTLLRRLKGEGK